MSVPVPPMNFAAGQAPPSSSAIQVYLAILESQERTRASLAYAVIGILAVLVGAGIAGMFLRGISAQQATQMFGLLFGPIIGLVGTVVGFYFGAKTASEQG